MNSEFHMNSSDAADKLHFEQRFSRFLIYILFCAVGFAFCWFQILFFVLFFILRCLEKPRKLSIIIVANHDLNIYIYVWLSLMLFFVSILCCFAQSKQYPTEMLVWDSLLFAK